MPQDILQAYFSYVEQIKVSVYIEQVHTIARVALP